MVEQLTAAAALPALGDTVLPGTFERGPHSVYLQGSNGKLSLGLGRLRFSTASSVGA